MTAYLVRLWHAGQRVEWPAASLEEAEWRATLELSKLRRLGFQVETPYRNRWNALHPFGKGRVHLEIRKLYP